MKDFSPIAVVGMSCVFPGAHDTDAFWQNIVDKNDATKTVPPERWITSVDHVLSNKYLPDRAVSARAGLISGFKLDPSGLELDSDLIKSLDPMYHLVLQTGRDAYSQLKAVSGKSPQKDRTGVILAAIALPTDTASELGRKLFNAAAEEVMFGGRPEFTSPSLPMDSFGSLAGKVTSLPATILAKALGFGGGAYTLDAACASSLYAIKLACDELNANRTDLMLAGGVSRPECLYTQIGFSQFRALSPSGRCAPFDHAADGLVVGEGAGIVALKRLEDAIRDGDTIHGVIRGIGLSNDLGGSLLSPVSQGQIRAMEKAYEQAGWSPDDVQMIECHGAGTPVGDSTELQSLSELWKDVDNAPKAGCALGSIKSMTGHLLTAAGAAGLIKMLLGFRHKTFPPSLHFEKAAPGTPISDGPFRVQTEPEPWPADENRPRRCAVSAFGFGGINAHVLLEQWAPEYQQSKSTAITRELPPPEVAVVGMACTFGPLEGLHDFEQAVNSNVPVFVNRPPERWKGCDTVAERFLGDWGQKGVYSESVRVKLGMYQIPPNEIGDVIPQQLMMLNVAANAMADAGLHLTESRPDMGAIIGMSFDHDATNFHFRWSLPRLIAEWRKKYNLRISENPDEADAWTGSIMDAASPPLTSARTLGALGSMTASRIAKAFRFGAPSFVVSSEEASGLKALEIGVRLLQQKEAEALLVGAVDMTGDVRRMISKALSSSGKATANESMEFPGDGAVALVLKPLQRAQADGNHIYSVIRGVGSASETDTDASGMVSVAYRNARSRCLSDAGDNYRIRPVDSFHVESDPKSIIGDTGAAAGLAGALKTCLMLDRCKADNVPDKQREVIAASGTSDGIHVHVLFEATPALNTKTGKTDHSTAFTDRLSNIEDNRPMYNRIVGGIMAFPDIPELLLSEKRGPAVTTENASMPLSPVDKENGSAPPSILNHLLGPMERQTAATSEAHLRFLDFSKTLTRAYADTLSYRTELVSDALKSSPQTVAIPEKQTADETPPAFSREMCMEFAVGSVANVFGPEFSEVDTYRARVRLPDEPLMLVDRILTIQGEKGVLGPGKVVTEHDVMPGAWYIDGGRAPLSISIEAGQADLFLCAYLGIDKVVKGKRTYRLLDAEVEFFRGLPRPGDVIRYDIDIERFVRQGETHLFFFHFDGRIGNEPFIRMKNGCAGFFTEEEVINSGGIIFTEKEKAHRPGLLPPDWSYPVNFEKAVYNESQLDALRDGNLADCFGSSFEGIRLSPSMRLPSGRLKLIHRVLEIDPSGGQFGIGRIRAEADIRPDNWFLTCHFVDDMVMPGTLMYECCVQTLRVFLQRLGWVSDKDGIGYEPVTGICSRLKCRGPVTTRTKKVIYEVDIKELGYGPEPFAIADAHMYADGRRIVFFENMCLKVSGLGREDVERLWTTHGKEETAVSSSKTSPVFDGNKILAFAEGNPSEAFGDRYKPFDNDRFIARLPRPPYSLISRVIKADAPQWEMAPGGWITAEYDVPEDAWYFYADRSRSIPHAILLEIALQPCGWLAAWAGSALSSKKDLRFRNLGGEAVLLQPPELGGRILATRSRMTKLSTAGDMIIQHYEFEVSHRKSTVYKGTTHFGFFTAEALSRQAGLGDITIPGMENMTPPRKGSLPHCCFDDEPPLVPEDGPGNPSSSFADIYNTGLSMPGKALRMVDTIDRYEPRGGPASLGYVSGSKNVDSREWFFNAHFFQDPVCPGSLGIESFLQLLKWVAIQRWPKLRTTHRFEFQTDTRHQWTYRGQITPSCQKVEIEAVITKVEEISEPVIWADGLLKVDGLCIYKMGNYGLKLVI